MSERVRVRPLTSFGDLGRLVDIQRAVWDHGDLDVTPVHQFAVSVRMGAILLGAFAGSELAGFVYSFPAVFRGGACQHSHLLAVLPRFQGRGLGKALKRAQREEALRRGIRLITWTFDPLRARNANLNLQALGAVSRTYIRNFYGMTPSLCLAAGVPTDRLLIEWPVRTARVRARLEGRAKWEPGPAGRAPRALERKAGEAGPLARPGRPRLDLEDRAVLVEVPRDLGALAGRPDIIAQWQRGLRRVMTAYFGRGYHAGHFLCAERAFYVLSKDR